MTTATQVGVSTAKATKEVVAKVDRFAEIKALIASLEVEKEFLTKEITSAFGEATLLTHHGVEVARLDKRSRTTADSKKLALEFPEAFEATKRVTAYSVIVNIPR